MSTIAGLPLDRIEVNVPRHGAWYANGTLTSGEAPSGQVTLVVGGLELVGTVIDGGLDAPDRPHVAIVGAPGWSRELERPLSYRSDAGVRLATVLQDLATMADETIEQPTGAPLGTHFSAQASSPRATVRLRDVLATLARQGHVQPWRVDPDGVTRFGDRVGVEVRGHAVEMSRDAAIGAVRVGIDDPSEWLPGALYGGEVIRRLVIREREDAREATVWLSGDTIHTSILRSVLERFPQLLYGHPITCRVAAVRADKRLDLVPLEDATGYLPELDAVDARGLGLVTPEVGAEVVVAFRDANPGRPMVIGWAHGAPHDEIDFGAEPFLGVARMTDPVQAGPFAGTITLGSLTVKAGT